MAAKTWSAEALVNTSKALLQTDSAVAALPGGGFVVTWTHNASLVFQGGDGDGSSIKMQRYDSAGNKLGQERLVNLYSEPGDQFRPDVAAFEDGSFVVAWGDDPSDPASDSGVSFQRFTSTGDQFPGGHFGTLATDNDVKQAPEIKVLPDGNIVILYDNRSPSGFGPAIATLDPAGGPITDPSPVIGTVASAYSMAVLESGDHVVAYRDEAANRVNFIIIGNVVGSGPVSESGGATQSEPNVAALAGGNFVVTWS